MHHEIAIQKSGHGQRLDMALAAALGVSRTEAKRLIERGAKVGGRPATPHLRVAEGDIVQFMSNAADAAEATPLPDVPILSEDKDIIVIDKPAGILMHPTARGERGTVADILVQRHPPLADVGDDRRRPGIVHRLDRDASGTVVVAKRHAAFEALKKQFQNRSVEKEYVVLVSGVLPKDEGDIRLAIGRSRRAGKMAARAQALEGDKPSLTRYRVTKRFAGATLVAVKTETGRTHQIRAHFAAIGHPVAGDPLYRAGRRARTASPRLFLHAARLAFIHPSTGKRVAFSAPLPAELAAVLEKLEAKN